jgi:hypothetical protein
MSDRAEEVEYVESIQADIRWRGFDWGEHLYFTSDYFEQLHRFSVGLIERGKAYVCDLSSDGIFERRGTLTEPGTNSPFRDRSVEENLDLFERMHAGEFENGDCTLRAKIWKTCSRPVRNRTTRRETSLRSATSTRMAPIRPAKSARWSTSRATSSPCSSPRSSSGRSSSMRPARSSAPPPPSTTMTSSSTSRG